MIISCAPFRISFAGGGSDIAVFYRRQRGAVLSATIDKYVYITVHPYYNRSRTLVKYSETECVARVEDIRHPILRQALLDLWPCGGVEVGSTADIPAATGLGSSSSFTVALQVALHAFDGRFVPKEELARQACELEIVKLGEPIGKQDQYAAAFGGLNFIEFHPDESVVVTPLVLQPATLRCLEENLLLFYTGWQRRSREILDAQNREVAASTARFDSLTAMVRLAYDMRDQLQAGDLHGFARSMHRGWELKRTLSGTITNPAIDSLYQRAIEAGALGGKLAGAGGGGFLLLYCEEERREALRSALGECSELPFSFDQGGARVIYVGGGTERTGFLREE